MVALEVGRWLLTCATAMSWLLMLDAIALAWPGRDRSDRVFLLFTMVAITWATVFEGNQAWQRYQTSPVELIVVIVAAFMWLVLGMNWYERRESTPNPMNGD